MWGLAAICGLFWNQPLLLVLFVAIELVLGNVGTLNRITLGVEVALVDLFEASFYPDQL